MRALVIFLCALHMLVMSEVAFAAKPGPTNTGPSNPSVLSPYTGPTVITTDNLVLENFTSGGLVIKADNVTLRNFRIRTSGSYGIKATDGGKNLLIEDGEISGMSSAGVYGSNFTALRLNVFDGGADGFKPFTNVVIQDSWIHKLGYIADSHADGVQMISGSNVVIKGNNFDMPSGLPGYNNSICIIIQTHGSVDNVTIEDNWINGGGYSVQVRDKGKGFGPPTNVGVVNNFFGKDYQYGPWNTDGEVLKSGNRWEATGVLLSGQSDGGTISDIPLDEPVAGSNEQVGFVTASKTGGVYLDQILVELSTATADAQIFYTVDGSVPSVNSQEYSSPFSFNSDVDLKVIAFKDGLDPSALIEEQYDFPPFTSTAQWNNAQLGEVLAPDNSSFSLSLTPVNLAIDSVVGFSNGPAFNYSDLAVILRFSKDGIIDVRNGSNYQSVNQVNYVPGTEYKFFITVDFNNSTYSVWLSSDTAGIIENMLIGDSFAFRSEQSDVTSLDNLSFYTIDGTAEIDVVEGLQLTVPNPPPEVF